jgi:4-amino-4-deoxy-L-arabinose transferase-like glycosyltransferase
MHHSAVTPASPNPALVTEAAAARLPRVALLLFCAAYVIPGVFGRDPWKNADLAAFGQMLAMAEGRAPWLAPALGGVPTDAALLPHWLGAAFVAATSPWLDPAFAARVPFALLLAFTLVALWYATYHLARTEAAQPLPFAFGGEAGTVDYARAIADASLLALIATLGLLQLGHETTPELAQLASVAGLQWALAAAPYRRRGARVGILLALPMLAGSGAPAMAMALGALATVVCLLSSYDQVRRFAVWVVAATVLAAACAWLLHAWSWRLVPSFTLPQARQLGRQWLWFLWPAWALGLWTLWRWRTHLMHRHISVPLVSVAVALAANFAMGGSDRALMLALPGLAALAAFALPTLRRQVSAAMDWFSVFFFTACALVIWVIYIAMQTGMPAKPAANVAKLAPGFEASFSAGALVLAALATLCWAWLVRWRTGRHRVALWKSLVLPAGGVALAWLLLMTLWLPLLDYARSYRPHVQQIARHVGPRECIAAPGMPLALVAALEYHGRWTVDRAPDAAARSSCPVLLRAAQSRQAPAAPAGWAETARLRRPTDREEVILIYRRDQ